MGIPMLKIRRPLGRLIFNMGITIPSETVFLIETAPWWLSQYSNDYNPFPISLIFTTYVIMISQQAQERGYMKGGNYWGVFRQRLAVRSFESHSYLACVRHGGPGKAAAAGYDRKVQRVYKYLINKLYHKSRTCPISHKAPPRRKMCAWCRFKTLCELKI